MFLSRSISKFTEDYSERIKKLKYELKTADAIVIGAGAGMSTSAEMAYDGERFEKTFSDFHEKYGIRTCIPAVFIRMIPWRNTGRGGAGR